MTREPLEIVGADLRLADRPHGSVVRVTRKGALLGGASGLLLGVFVTVVAETSMTGLAVVVWGAVYGAIAGTLAGFFQGLVRNRPDAVTTEVVPTRYEVRCAPADATVATALLTSWTIPGSDPVGSSAAGEQLDDAA